MSEYDLTSCKIERTSVFRKIASVPRRVPMTRVQSTTWSHRAAIAMPSRASKEVDKLKEVDTSQAAERGCLHQFQAGSQAPRDVQTTHQCGLDEIRRLADRGRLDDAARLCEEHLRMNGALPETLHLLGLICEAAGKQQEAADYYRKALYLDPNHYQTLVHLSMTLQNQGDSTGTKLLSNRLRRLENRERKHHA